MPAPSAVHTFLRRCRSAYVYPMSRNMVPAFQSLLTPTALPMRQPSRLRLCRLQKGSPVVPSVSVSTKAALASDSTSRAKERQKTQQKGVTPRAEDYSQWYLDIISSAELAESSPVKGCMVIRPHGYEIWELLRDELDVRIKRSGARNAYFPLLIPQSFLSREAKHVDGFAKECAVVTHHRLRPTPGAPPGNLEPDPDAKLEEPLIVRPTSETIIWHMFGRWIQSYRDLPLVLNQWANVLRWEMRTRPFLRTAEFLWQEGHTAHSNAEEAETKAKEMIRLYADAAREMLAIPSIMGVKSPGERFAGALETYTIECLMQNGWALQAATSHFLGQNFAKAFDVTYKSPEGDEELVWASSWGITTRMIGALIMIHSDDTGLVLPPKVAPVQIALVLIFKSEEQRRAVVEFADAVFTRLKARGLRIAVDDRPNMRPGAKYYEWERKGVPLRMEIGPRDAAKNAVFAAKRIGGTKESIPVNDDFETVSCALLDRIQEELLGRAEERLASHTRRVSSYEEMKDCLASGGEESGMFLVPWKCDADNERRVREDTKATLRCYPIEGQRECNDKTCIYSGDPATHMAIFARNY